MGFCQQDNDRKSRTFKAGIARVFGDFSDFCGRPFILQIATIHKIPTLISWDFFCPFPLYWRGLAHFPLERRSAGNTVFHAQNPVFCLYSLLVS